MVCVLDQAPAITEVGAGLQLSPNGARVLRALGIDPAEAGDATEAVELRNTKGALVARLDMRGHPGFHLCHRADLIGVLERAARQVGAEIKLLQRIDSVTPDTHGTRLDSAIGDTRHAPLLIGADGLHSVVRAHLNPGSAPFFTGQVAWRALIPGDSANPVAQVFMGPGRHLVSYPLRGGRLRNIVAVLEQDAWVAEGWNHPDSPDALREAFAGFGGPVPEWLGAVSQVWLWGLFRHPVARAWYDPAGRMALVGDAAHPTLPFMAQGANLALEDAWVLADSLRQAPSQAVALAHYQQRRAARAAAVVAAANANARNYHYRGATAWLGHQALRTLSRLSPGALYGRYRWIYDCDVTAGG